MLLRRKTVLRKFIKINIYNNSYRFNSSISWLSLKQEDTNLEAISKKYVNGGYNEWFIERWLEKPINYVQDGLEIIHFGLGIPWWSTIAITAIAVRLSCFPLLLINYKQVLNGIDSQSVIKLIADEYKYKKNNNYFNSISQERKWFKNLYNNITQITGYRIYKLFLYPFGLILTLPSFIFAARSIARRTNHDLNEGGLLWFIDLTQPDIYIILPFIATTMTYFVLIYKSGKWLDGRYSGQFHKYISFTYFMISSWPLLLISMTINLPTAIFCYWIPFSIFGLFSKLIIRSNYFKKKLNILPPLQGKLNEPENVLLNKYYHQLLKDFKRVHKLKKGLRKNKKQCLTK